jgi:hypothetical protein
MSNAELVALRVRVIALENLVISLLATESNQQLELAHEMAAYISPRPGFNTCSGSYAAHRDQRRPSMQISLDRG